MNKKEIKSTQNMLPFPKVSPESFSHYALFHEEPWILFPNALTVLFTYLYSNL